MSAKTMTPAQFAETVESDARTVRKFLRAEIGTVGKGSRHTIAADARSLKALTKRFAEWSAARDAGDSPDASTDDE